MLDNQSLKILKFFAKHDTVKKEQLINKFGEENAIKHLNLLVKKQYVTGTTVTQPTQNYFTKEIKEIPFIVGPYSITPQGKAYLEKIKSEQKYRRYSIIHDCLNTAIAIGALIVAILAYIKQ